MKESVFVHQAIGGDDLKGYADFVRIFFPGSVQTYNGQSNKYGRVKTDKDWTFGGYSGQHTVPEKYS